MSDATKKKFREQDLLELTERFARRDSLETATVQYEQLPGKTLQIQLDDLGNIQQTIIAELSFLPMPHTEGEVYIGQLVAAIFTDLPAEHITELMRTCMYVNGMSPVGGFCIMEDVLYYRHNLLLRAEYPLEFSGQMLFDVVTTFQSNVETSIDGFAMVSHGLRTMEEAAEDGLLG